MIPLIQLFVRISSVTFLLLFVIEANAQNDCSFTLTKAQKLYDAGQIEQIPQMLNPCIENGFTSEEKLQAQKLIILIQLFDNNIKEADKSMLAFLKKYPEYEVLPSDQAEFVQLFNTYRALPIASVGVIFGTNWSIIGSSNLYDVNGQQGTYTNNGFNYNIGLTYKQYIKGNIFLNLEAIYSKNSYSNTNSKLPANITNSTSETQTRLEFPLSVIYETYKIGKFGSYLRGGINTAYSSSSIITSTLTGPEITKPTPVDFTMTNYRNQLQFMPLIGCGINFHVKGLEFMLDLRYNMAFKNQVKDAKTRLVRKDTDNDLLVNNLYIDNDFSWKNLVLSAGISYRFYKPQKRVQ